jgi:hypothetical protein
VGGYLADEPGKLFESLVHHKRTVAEQTLGAIAQLGDVEREVEV